MKKYKAPIPGRLRRKLFLLCSLLVIAASVVFAVVGIIRLRSSMRVAKEMNESQIDTIKAQSQETITRLMYDNMQSAILLAAQNVDGEFWTMRHDFTMLGNQVQDVFENPDKYGERKVNPPDPANAGKYTLQLIFSNDEAAKDPETLTMNFEKLEYISSAGLRTLLAAQQFMEDQGYRNVKVLHINETIRETFDVTGFFDVLDVETD